MAGYGRAQVSVARATDDRSRTSESRGSQRGATSNAEERAPISVHGGKGQLPADVLALQQTAGNSAVAGLVGRASQAARGLHRQQHATAPDAATENRLKTLEDKEAVTAKRVSALELDNRWEHRFGERFASFEQVIDRISGAIDDATGGFTRAHQEQAQADAMAIQVIGFIATVTLAAGFEWAMTRALGALNFEAKKIEAIVETVENPMNALASASVNVAGTATANADAERAQPAPATSSAVGFMASNREALAERKQHLEQAFVDRRTELDKLTPDKWTTFNVEEQNGVYQTMFDGLNKSFAGVEKLKPRSELAMIIERNMWARWIMHQDQAAREATQRANEAGAESGSGPVDLDPNNPNRPPEFSLGGYVEDRLNELRIGAMAGVKLSGHAWWPNSPHDWMQKLFSWCESYKEPLGS